MKLSPFIANLLLSTALTFGKTFDLLPAGWRLTWENVTIKGHLDLIECVLGCETRRRCIGGRLEAATRKCHLTFRKDGRGLAMYKQDSTGADRVFGVTCDPKSGFFDQPGFAVTGFNVGVFSGPATIEECEAFCLQTAWCRTMEHDRSNGRCHISNVDNSSFLDPYENFVLRTRNC